MNFPLISDRLHLDVIKMADAPDVFHTMNDKNTAEIVSFLVWPMTLTQAQWWCEKAETAFADGTEYLLLARHKDTNQAVGCIGIHRQSDEMIRAEIGYWVAPDYQGQGYASEMLRAGLNFGFSDSGIETFFATTAFENPASVHVLEKQGFVLECKKGVQLPNGSERPSLYFVLRKPVF